MNNPDILGGGDVAKLAFHTEHEFDGVTAAPGPIWRYLPPVPGRYIKEQYYIYQPDDQFSGIYDSMEVVNIVFGVNGPEIVRANGTQPLKESTVYSRRFFGPIPPDPRVVDGKLTEGG